ncbi:MAG: Abi family protein [Candidatus Eremiobacteraeota bacterium]|nr:Abi family protein [Candidatus Eremiobacteraeota bacterium]
MSIYFRIDGPLESAIEAVIGADRFAPYLTAAGNQSDALKLYSWNTALAAAFLGPISFVEVGLRNAISGQLRSAYGPAWYDDASFLGLDSTPRTRDNVSAAKSRILRAVPARPLTEGRIIAEMYLSFWTYLLRPALNRTLWPVLRPAFKKHAHRKTLVRYLEPLVPFRNRVAHHEPIFNHRPHEMYDNLLLVAEMLSPELPGWVEHHARVRSMLADGPVTPGVKF